MKKIWLLVFLTLYCTQAFCFLIITDNNDFKNFRVKPNPRGRLAWQVEVEAIIYENGFLPKKYPMIIAEVRLVDGGFPASLIGIIFKKDQQILITSGRKALSKFSRSQIKIVGNPNLYYAKAILNALETESAATGSMLISKRMTYNILLEDFGWTKEDAALSPIEWLSDLGMAAVEKEQRRYNLLTHH